MHFLQAINSDISVLIVCNKTGGTIKGDIKKIHALYHLHCDQLLARNYGNWWKTIYYRSRIQRTWNPPYCKCKEKSTDLRGCAQNKPSYVTSQNEGCTDAGDMTKIPRNPIHNHAGLKQCLPVPLEEASRKYTAFEFQSKMYQYKRIPCGFSNSLAGFMWSLQKVLGDETCSYVIT